jgi:hypothetical protein
MKMKKIIYSLVFTVLSVNLVFAQGTGKDIANMASGGSIGTATNTVDKYALFNIIQTTANQTITIPNPTVTTNYRNIEIRNKGSVSFTLVPGGVVDTSNYFTLTWIGSKWVFNSSGAVSSGSGGASIAQTVTNGDLVNAPSGNAVYDFVQVVQDDINAHEANTSNPHSVTKAQLGIPLVDNTSDAGKPISVLQQAGLDLKQDKVVGKGLSTEDYSTAEKSKLAGIAPGATANSSDAFLLARGNHTGSDAISDVSGLQTALDLKAPLISPSFTTPALGAIASGNLANGTGYLGANLTITDITTNNATTSAHGFLKKLSGIATQYQDGTGNWSVPAGGGGADSSTFATKYFVNTGLATKQNTFTSQAKNTIFRGPVIGSNAIPSFGPLTNFDLANENKVKGVLVGTPLLLADSYGVGQQASPSTESWANKFAAYNGVALNNASVGGIGVYQACYIGFQNENQAITAVSNSTIWAAGFNDLRRNGSNATTLLKIKGCLRSAIANHFLLYGGVSAASVVTNSGSWSNFTGALDKSAASAIGNARQSSTLGNTLTYTSPASSNIVIGTWNTDGTTYDYGRFTVTIDGTVVQTFNPNSRTDLVSDGTYDNGRTHEALVYEGLRNAAHTVVVTLLDNKTTVVDYFGVMGSGLINQSMFVVSIPKMNSTGYAISPANGSDAAFDAGDVSIKEVVDEFPLRPVYYCALNNYLNTTTDIGADNIHLSNLGYTDYFRGVQANIRAFVIPSKIPSIAGGINCYIYNQNQFVLGTNRNLAGTSDNVALAQAQMTITAANGDSNFQFFTSATNNTTTLAFKITKDGNLEALKNANGELKIGTTNTVICGVNGDIGVLSVNRNIAGAFTNINKSSAAIYLKSATSAGTIEFYSSPSNNTAPLIAGNINENQRWFIGGSTSATAKLHIGASSGAASTGAIKFVNGTQLVTPESMVLEPETGGLNLLYTPQGGTVQYTLSKTLKATATLDFPSTAAGANQDLTITLTGAAVGDPVMLAMPASVASGTGYEAWVSATNTITVRHLNYMTVTADDPASASFTVALIKY